MAKSIKKRAVVASFLSLSLCTSMLIGATYAWFTDSAVSSGNIIKSGTLDIEMSWANGTDNPTAETTEWKDAASSDDPIFKYELWEPGYTSARHIRLVNNGNLALKYTLTLLPDKNAPEPQEGDVDLAEVIDVYYTAEAKAITDRDEIAAPDFDYIGTLRQVIDSPSIISSATKGSLMPKDTAGSTTDVTIVLKMQETAGNEYQDQSVFGGFVVKAFATQFTYESDTFDELYDEDADFAEEAEKKGATKYTDNGVTVTVPEGITTGLDNVKLTASAPTTTAPDTDGIYTVNTDIKLTINGNIVPASADDPYLVEFAIAAGLEKEDIKVYHGDDEVTEFEYDATTGVISFATVSFSPFKVTYEKRYSVILNAGSNCELTASVNGTALADSDKVKCGTVVAAKVDYTGLVDLNKSFSIKQGENSITYYSDANCTNATTSVNEATYYFIMPVGDVTVSGSASDIIPEDVCVAPGSKICLADGTQKLVEEITAEDTLLVWNLEEGKYDTAPAIFNHHVELEQTTVVHACFSDGTEIKIIGEHGLFDLDLGKYVYVSKDHTTEYIGHRFVKLGDISNDTWQEVTLDSVRTETVNNTEAYSPITAKYLCLFTDDILSVTGYSEGLINIFDVDTSTMKYDQEKMQADIETYGLSEYADFAHLISKDFYDAFNGDWMNVSIGKGLTTQEKLIELIQTYAQYIDL